MLWWNIDECILFNVLFKWLLKHQRTDVLSLVPYLSEFNNSEPCSPQHELILETGPPAPSPEECPWMHICFFWKVSTLLWMALIGPHTDFLLSPWIRKSCYCPWLKAPQTQAVWYTISWTHCTFLFFLCRIHLHTHVSAAIVTIARLWNQPRCLSL